MLRIALKGLSPASCARHSPAFAVVLGVAFVRARSCSPTRSTPRSRTCSSALRRASTSTSPPSSAVEERLRRRRRRCRPHAGKVKAVDGVAAAQGNLEQTVSICRQAGRAVVGNGPPTLLFSSGDEALRPADLRRGRPAAEPRRGGDGPGHRREGRLQGRRQGARRRPRAGEAVHGLGHRQDRRLRQPRRLADGRCRSPRCSSIDRIPDGYARSSSRPTGGTTPEAAQGGDRARAGRHGRRAHRQGAGREAGADINDVAGLHHAPRCSCSPASPCWSAAS